VLQGSDMGRRIQTGFRVPGFGFQASGSGFQDPGRKQGWEQG